jgi:hypothetical protein
VSDAYALVQWARTTPLREEAIEDAVEAVRNEGDAAWNTIEPLAGMLYPRVRAEVERRLRDQP